MTHAVSIPIPLQAIGRFSAQGFVIMLVADQFQEQANRRLLFHRQSGNLSQEVLKKRPFVQFGVKAVDQK